MRRAPFAIALALTIAPVTALAAAEAGEPRPAKDVGTAVTLGGLIMDSLGARQTTRLPNEGWVLFQLAGWYHLTKSFAVGGVGSYSGALGSSELWRLSGEARFFPVTWRFADVWVSAEAGWALSLYLPDGEPTGWVGTPLPAPDTGPRVAPLAGIGAGIDLLPIREISLGVEGRAMVPIFLGPPAGDGPSGFSPAVSAGLTFAFHLPTT
jgi:hypothetical protein